MYETAKKWLSRFCVCDFAYPSNRPVWWPLAIILPDTVYEHRFHNSSYPLVGRCGERANSKINLSYRPPCAGERRVLNRQKFTAPCGAFPNSLNPLLSCCSLAAPRGTAIQAVAVVPSVSWRRLTSASYNCGPLCPGRAARGRKYVPRRDAARRNYLNFAALLALPGGVVIGSRNAAAP